MKADLFSHSDGLRPLPIPGAEVFYASTFDVRYEPQTLMHCLINQVPWRTENVVVWGKSYPQPRLIAWYGDAGRSYQYSGVTLEPLPWIEPLQVVRERVQHAVDCNFNSVLLNYYRDNRDSMGFHSDDVAVRWQLTAIHNGEPFEQSILAIYRFEDGRIAEDWGIAIRACWP